MKKRKFLIYLFVICFSLTCISGCSQIKKYSTQISTHIAAAFSKSTSSSSKTSQSSSGNNSNQSAASSSNQSKPLTINDELKIAPDLDGAKKVLQDNGSGSEVTYVAESGNSYGVEANKYLGVYRENVIVEGKEVGGVALVPNVVQKLLNDELAKIPTGQDKLKVVVPLDMAEAKSADVDISTLDVNGTTTYIKIDCSEKVDVYNIIPGSENLLDDWMNDGNTSKMGILVDVYMIHNPTATHDDLMRYLRFFVRESDVLNSKNTAMGPTSFGKLIAGNNGESMMISCEEKLPTSPNHAIGVKNLLNVNGVIVGLTSSK